MSQESKRKRTAVILGALGSLKLTVTLLAMSIFLVFAGTLAQRFQGIWTVVDQYFRCAGAWLEWRIFFPREWEVKGGFPFPGGWLLGTALGLNLLVAHLQRIHVQVRGPRLAFGVVVTAIGVGLTWLGISSVFDMDSSKKTLSPFWRVTFQLLQGGGAATILFLGFRLLFARKAGIALLHGGIVLLMIHELITGLFAEEGSMTIYEGQAVHFKENSREVELAVIDPSAPDTDDVVAVSERLLRKGHPIRHSALPFDVDPAGRFMRNAQLRRLHGGEPNVATEGTGLVWKAEACAESPGVESAASNEPAVYLTFKEKGSGRPLGTFLVALRLTLNHLAQQVKVGEKAYNVFLRFRRTYTPYQIYLYDFRYERYPGTSTPKDYSSDVRLIDRERGVERDVRIWMNNPLRYRGDTIYQVDFDKTTEAATVLQVVDNESWMIPYVACTIVAVGMLGQFWLHLKDFVRRRASET